MGYREARELARIRQELRERLMAATGAEDLLERLGEAARIHATAAPELHGEYERWRVRFALLAMA